MLNYFTETLRTSEVSERLVLGSVRVSDRVSVRVSDRESDRLCKRKTKG